MLFRSGQKIKSGFDILFYGNIPNGAGLSSSASIEILTAVVLKDLFNLDIDMIEMVKIGQKNRKSVYRSKLRNNGSVCSGNG